MAALDDHGDSPYTQDLDGMWHLRRDSSWTPPPAAVQCVTECGRRIASVHVAESDPRLRGLSEDERACEICLPNPPPPNGDSMTKRYRKLPVEIEAVQLTRENGPEVWEWAESKPWYGTDGQVDGLTIFTLEGRMKAEFGDYIIKGVKGEFYPCKPDIFEATYEPVKADV